MKPIQFHPSDLSRNYSGDSQIFTPPEIVDFMIDSIDIILKYQYNKEEGLQSTNLTFFDPSAGLLAFPLGLLRKIKKTSWIQEVFVEKCVMLELDKKLIAQSRQILEKQLNSVSKDIKTENLHENLNLYCGNSLADPEEDKVISKVIDIRDKIPLHKKDILIVFGNPPYAISSNLNSKNTWIKNLLNDYKTHLHPPNRKKITGLKAIQDEYIKFIRLAQWKLSDQNNNGILAYIVNNYFLDGMVFRGMRHSLLSNFDKIYIVNLHGDPKKREGTGVKDDNVFPIQTGVCIIFALKYKRGRSYATNSKLKESMAPVYYCESKGTVPEKYEFLDQGFEHLLFDHFELVPESRDYEFIPKSKKMVKLEEEYFSYTYLPNIFKKHIVGAQSLHDTLVTHPDKDTLKEIIKVFYAQTPQNTESSIDKKGQTWINYKDYKVTFHDARDWKIQFGLEGSYEKGVKNIIQWQKKGFDKWYVSYDEHLMTRGTSGFSLMQSMLPHFNNLAIGTSRTSRKASGENSVLITNSIAESHFIEGGSGIGDYLFPLKYNPIINQIKRYDWNSPMEPTHYNFSIDFLYNFIIFYDLPDDFPELTEGDPITTINSHNENIFQAIFYYIYAILWTPQYRNKYQSLLKLDFPRIPFPKGYNQFNKFANLGKQLVETHLVKDIHVDPHEFPLSKTLQINHSLLLRNFRYDTHTNKIYINEDSHWIGNIPKSIWEFEIGGINQLQTWLNARKLKDTSKKYGWNRAITQSEFQYFLKMCKSIDKTPEIQSELQNLFEYCDFSPIDKI